MSFSRTYYAKAMGIRNTLRMPKSAGFELIPIIREKFSRLNQYSPEFLNSMVPSDAMSISHLILEPDDLYLPPWTCILASSLGRYFHIRILCTGQFVETNHQVKQTLTLIGNHADIKLVLSIIQFFNRLHEYFRAKYPHDLRMCSKKIKKLCIDISLILNKLLENRHGLTENTEDLIAIKCSRRDRYIFDHFRIIKRDEIKKQSIDYLITPNSNYQYMKFIC